MANTETTTRLTTSQILDVIFPYDKTCPMWQKRTARKRERAMSEIIIMKEQSFTDEDIIKMLGNGSKDAGKC